MGGDEVGCGGGGNKKYKQKTWAAANMWGECPGGFGGDSAYNQT